MIGVASALCLKYDGQHSPKSQTPKINLVGYRMRFVIAQIELSTKLCSS